MTEGLRRGSTVRFVSTNHVIAKGVLKYYRFSWWGDPMHFDVRKLQIGVSDLGFALQHLDPCKVCCLTPKSVMHPSERHWQSTGQHWTAGVTSAMTVLAILQQFIYATERQM